MNEKTENKLCIVENLVKFNKKTNKFYTHSNEFKNFVTFHIKKNMYILK